MFPTERSYILFDDPCRDHLLPFTFIRPVSEIRIGILTIREKWEKWTGLSFSHFTQDYLQEKYPLVTGEENILVNGSVTPNEELIGEIMNLRCGETLVKHDLLVAGCFDRAALEAFVHQVPEGYRVIPVQSDLRQISRLWHIFRFNGEELVSDFECMTHERASQAISKTNNLIGDGPVFIEGGVTMEQVTLNSTNGPIYIGRDASVMEGSLIRGPFALCEGALVKMGTRIYGPTTVGPYSKIGGEVTNSVIMGFSNKVHDGYLGNSVIGEWCNIGAGSNTSNLKNNYNLVRLWDYAIGREIDTGLQFCGLFMGDYSRCGINTMFNTGTVVGVSANIYGSGYPGNFIPSFSWGGAAGFETYRLGKALETIETGLTLRQLEINETDRKIINRVFALTGRYRKSV
jgi:UDP-N-acetylglucosamine diphosphorylase/glucosamine-1-phosphate N-acetyltransferase